MSLDVVLCVCRSVWGVRVSLCDGGSPWDTQASLLCGGVSGCLNVGVGRGCVSSGLGFRQRPQAPAPGPPHSPTAGRGLGPPTLARWKGQQGRPAWPERVALCGGAAGGEKLGGRARPGLLVRRRWTAPADPGGPGSPLPAASRQPLPALSLPSLHWPVAGEATHSGPGEPSSWGHHGQSWAQLSLGVLSAPRLCREVSDSQSACCWGPLEELLSPHREPTPPWSSRQGTENVARKPGGPEASEPAPHSFIHSFFRSPLQPLGPQAPGERRAPGVAAGSSAVSPRRASLRA